jgi:ubiquinone/menaquinone biosynthesis C-methylase UbiE
MVQDQIKVWNSIAPEWHEYKKHSSELAKEFLKAQKGKILDLGSGSGRHLIKSKDSIFYLSDFSSKMIELAKQKAKKLGMLRKTEFSVADMAELPYEDNFFDAALSISAIHCTPKKQHKKIIKELYRVMKPKSKTLIGVWNKKSKRFRNPKSSEKLINWTDKGERYYYLFEEKEIRDLFTKAGFKIIKEQNSEMMIRFIAKKE